MTAGDSQDGPASTEPGVAPPVTGATHDEAHAPPPAETKAPDQTNDIDRVASRVQSQQETIDYLMAYIKRLEAQLNDRIDGLEGITGRGRSYQPQIADPVDWRTADPKLTPKLRSELAEFVNYLVTRHGLARQIRTCWFQHGAAVEELTGLWTARKVALASNADASMLSWWQDLLERSELRLRRIFVKCREGHADQAQEWMTNEDQKRLENWIREEEPRSS